MSTPSKMLNCRKALTGALSDSYGHRRDQGRTQPFFSRFDFAVAKLPNFRAALSGVSPGHIVADHSAMLGD
jgi:hypothetical protein